MINNSISSQTKTQLTDVEQGKTLVAPMVTETEVTLNGDDLQQCSTPPYLAFQTVQPGPYPLRSTEALSGSPNVVPLTPPPSGNPMVPLPNPVEPSSPIHSFNLLPTYTDLDNNTRYLTNEEIQMLQTEGLPASPSSGYQTVPQRQPISRRCGAQRSPEYIQRRSAAGDLTRSPMKTFYHNQLLTSPRPAEYYSISQQGGPKYLKNQIIYPPAEIIDDGIREPVNRAPRRVPHQVLTIKEASDYEYKIAEYNSSLLYLNLHVKGTEAYQRLPFLINERGVVVFLPKGTPLPSIYKRSSLESLQNVNERLGTQYTGSKTTTVRSQTDVDSVYSRGFSHISPPAPRRWCFFPCCPAPDRGEEEKLESYRSFELHESNNP